MDMKISSIILFLLTLGYANAQETVPSTGGVASGNGGVVTYTIGQINYNTFSGANGAIIQGVQQPYEIIIATAIENTEEVTLELKVFPNPTSDKLYLTIEDLDSENIKYILFGVNGNIYQEKNIENIITEISMDNFRPSVYFLKVIRNNIEIKTFKIIKK